MLQYKFITERDSALFKSQQATLFQTGFIIEDKPRIQALMKKTVLIVEDNELNMKLFNDLLEANGYATQQSKNGIEAIELAKRYLPDLILMDIQLPELSGLEAISLIKAEPSLKAIPIIAITAFAMRGDEEKIRLAGCEGYISKPISVVKFLEAVNTFLKQDP